MNILIGVTGSIAATLLPKLRGIIYKDIPNTKVKVIYTQNAIQFIDDPNAHWITSYQDKDEWISTETVLHILLRQWADVLLIAPCTANTLAKIANGISDNLLTNVARAWDFNKQFIVAPSMNNMMWNHPITKTHINTLQSWGIDVVSPQEKKLYCGETGIGAMANISEIIQKIKLT